MEVNQPTAEDKELHDRFRNATSGIVERGTKLVPSFSVTNFIGQCHTSIEHFMNEFPEAIDRRRVVETVEMHQRNSAAFIKEGMDLIDQIEKNGGLTYEQEEELRYEFPNPLDNNEDDV